MSKGLVFLSKICGIALLSVFFIGLIPGDARSYLLGYFEAVGPDVSANNVNPWSLEYMSFHYGTSWLLNIVRAVFYSLLIAVIAGFWSLVFLSFCFLLLNTKTRALFDGFSALLLSLVSLLVAPIIAVFYFRYFSVETQIFTFLLAGFSVSFVSMGSFLKFLDSKYLDQEYAALDFALKARGVTGIRKVYVHFLKLFAPDFLVLFFSRFSSQVTGVLVAETVFNIHGLGMLFSEAFQSRSSLMIVILVMITAFLTISLNQFSVWLATRLDPRRNLGI